MAWGSPRDTTSTSSAIAASCRICLIICLICFTVFVQTRLKYLPTCLAGLGAAAWVWMAAPPMGHLLTPWVEEVEEEVVEEEVGEIEEMEEVNKKVKCGGSEGDAV